MKEEKDTGYRLKIRLFYLVALILLIHCSFFVVYWMAVGNFRADVDKYIGNITGWQLPYVTFAIVFALLIGIWILVRLVRFRLPTRRKVQKTTLANWMFYAVLVIFLVLFYAAYIIILRENPAQMGVLDHLFNLIRLVSDALFFLLAALFLRRLILFFRRKRLTAVHRWPWAAGIFGVLFLLVGLWLVPALFPPNWAYKGDLPAKPALIAHRGASMLAPENTLAAAELAAVNQAFGFETDVRITLDGIPVLMHDETLERTTNIAEVFPERTNDLVSSFTLEELKQLNAGLWFIQKDPFRTIRTGSVSQTQLGINQGQRIPTLSETLDLMDRKGMVIIFDMRDPPSDHPHYEDFFDIVLSECQQSGLHEDIWFLVSREQIQLVRESAPRLTRVIGSDSRDLPEPEDLMALGYVIINVDSGILTESIESFRKSGLGVNVYTIDQPWLFSQFWLSGVTSITTNNVHTLSQIKKPFLNLPYSRYQLFWGLFGIIVGIWLAGSQPECEREEPGLVGKPEAIVMDHEEHQEVNTVDLSAVLDGDQSIIQDDNSEGT